MAEPAYCPICAHPLTTREDGGRVRPACENCGYIHYINPVPTVGVVIEMDGGVVLIKRGRPPHKGQWAFPSGYVEADERLEEAAAREAEEETGLIVEILDLADVNSYPEGPPASGVMIFYHARPVGGELRAGDDADDVAVFGSETAPLLPFRTHREMMAQWLAAKGHTPHATHHEPATPFTIRMATVADSREVVELVRMIPENFSLTESDWELAMRRVVETDSLEVYVAQLNDPTGIIIGAMGLSVVRTMTEGYGFVNDVAVLPTYRRQGVGAALLEMVMRRASDLNLVKLLVNTSRADDRARAFFANAGFTSRTLTELLLK